MNLRLSRLLVITAALMFFFQGCAVFIRDKDHFHHRYHRGGWYSSVEQSPQPANQVVAHQERLAVSHGNAER